VPEFHNVPPGRGADHGSDAVLAADGVAAVGGAALSQTDEGVELTFVHKVDGAPAEDAEPPLSAAGNLFVSTTPGVRDCGTLGEAGSGAWGIIAVGIGDGALTGLGVVRFNVGDTGGCGTDVGGSTSFGAVCEYATDAIAALKLRTSSTGARTMFIQVYLSCIDRPQLSERAVVTPLALAYCADLFHASPSENSTYGRSAARTLSLRFATQILSAVRS